MRARMPTPLCFVAVAALAGCRTADPVPPPADAYADYLAYVRSRPLAGARALPISAPADDEVRYAASLRRRLDEAEESTILVERTPSDQERCAEGEPGRAYLNYLSHDLDESWQRQSVEGAMAEVRFTLGADGSIATAEIVRQNDPALAESVLRAMRGDRSLRPPPDCMVGEALSGTFRNPPRRVTGP
jgi:hypothetical protein